MDEIPDGEKKNKNLDAWLESALTHDRTAKFQLWQLLLGLLLAIAAVILFAAAAIKGEESDSGPIAHAARAIADIPLVGYTVAYEAATSFHPRLAKAQRFKGEAGFKKAAGAADAAALVALSRFDGDARRGLIEIMSMNDGAVLWTYRPDLKEIYARATTPEKISHLRRDHSPSRFLPHHPLILADGSVIFHGMDSPLVKMDACSRIVWMLDGDYHHSIEPDGEGGFWATRTMRTPSIDHVDGKFQDEAIVHVSDDGDIVFERSVPQALIRNGYSPTVYSRDRYDSDPIHLNDVQPVRSDGKYWKKGDLFLSLRNPSMIALYRPATDEIIWSKQGPWLMQHDIDIVNDHVIGVFDNNAVASPDGEDVLGTNKILEYDFDSDAVVSVYEAGLTAASIRTKTNGLFRLLADGGVMVEEQNFGRLVGLAPDGALRWTYVNRAPKDGRVYQLGWSRALEGAQAEKLKTALAEAKCEN